MTVRHGNEMMICPTQGNDAAIHIYLLYYWFSIKYNVSEWSDISSPQTVAFWSWASTVKVWLSFIIDVVQSRHHHLDLFSPWYTKNMLTVSPYFYSFIKINDNYQLCQDWILNSDCWWNASEMLVFHSVLEVKLVWQVILYCYLHIYFKWVIVVLKAKWAYF
jgi:hypothetical protein